MRFRLPELERMYFYFKTNENLCVKFFNKHFVLSLRRYHQHWFLSNLVDCYFFATPLMLGDSAPFRSIPLIRVGACDGI